MRAGDSGELCCRPWLIDTISDISVSRSKYHYPLHQGLDIHSLFICWPGKKKGAVLEPSKVIHFPGRLSPSSANEQYI